MDVETDTGEIIQCRTYQLIDLPDEIEDLEGNLPSLSYLKVIVKGAVESHLPDHYISHLRHIKHNGNMVSSREDALHLHEVVM